MKGKALKLAFNKKVLYFALGDKSHLIHNTLSRKRSLKWIIFGIVYIIHQPIQILLGDITGTVFIKTYIVIKQCL